ncbi:M3 family oligoendopeptidase [Halobacillus sp. ACCC02827]|uniref:M3 family oligoendopeptidase n=1 Tax=Halobacillus sp. ACCC02827 TaxID=3052090 RepID=UPI00256FE2EC|nr:M3 family oligoendopeptidase [Halobacillus sp. ACCC02827]WJE15175.1 M3 family oligoendopeptidase [Halobacillus sp. ACCC02827]
MKQTVPMRWDLDSLYPGGSRSPKLMNFLTELQQSIENITNDIHKLQPYEEVSTEPLVQVFDEIQYVMSGSFQVEEFLICLRAENTQDDHVTKMIAESAKTKADLEKMEVEFDSLLASLSEHAWNELLENTEVRTYLFHLKERRQRIEAKRPHEIEKTIQSLSVSGFSTWEDHYEQQLSKLRVPVETAGKTEPFSIGQAFSEVLFSDEEERRKTIIQSYNHVCASHADTFASILNNISGFRLDVYRERGWDNVLKEALEQNRINEETVDTMTAVVKENQHLLRDFLERKAQLARKETLTWYDIPTSSFQSKQKISYAEAKDIIVQQFHAFSEKLGAFAEKAFQEGWIEAEDRADKMDGGFCTSLPLAKESRIFLSFRGHYQDVVTIAHELGHAYHNAILHELPYFARQKGTSVAETASTFSENLVLDAAVNRATTDQEKLALLEMKIVAGSTYLGMIPSMYEFEKEFYKKRQNGYVGSEEISTLMEKTETALYGDTVGEHDRYRWMTIPQFYSTEKPFYNIPYTIGYLFSNGIYTLSKQQGEGFARRYDALLRDTGRMTVEQLAAAHLHQDLTDKHFWEASIKPVADAIEEYLELTNTMV